MLAYNSFYIILCNVDLVLKETMPIHIIILLDEESSIEYTLIPIHIYVYR
jgi:hypothetical protein